MKIIKTGRLHTVLLSFTLNGHECVLLKQHTPTGEFNGYYEIRCKHPGQGPYTAGLYPLYASASNCYTNSINNIQEIVHASVG